jgi:hypothetical protein
MNIKSLLLGSAAALIAVSGARAADAVTVAEPEPAQYVKICDVYGTGYFYIPGTETCLRIGGYVRYEMGMGDVGSFDGSKAFDVRSGKEQSNWAKNARFTLKTWTGQETELGTLKTYTETRFNFGNNNDYAITSTSDAYNRAHNKGVSLNFAWMQLGGLRVGRDDSVFDSFIGYAGNVIQDTIVPYGNFDTNLVSYYFDAGNGFSAVVSLEQASKKYTVDSYVPHVVGGVKYTQGWGAISAVAAYDSNYEEFSGKVRVDFNVTNELSLFAMGGYGTDKHLVDDTNNFVKVHGRGFYKPWAGHWAFWTGATYKFNEKTSFNLQVSGDQQKNYGVAANIAYDVVPGFTVTAEVDYDHYGEFNNPSVFGNWTNADKKNSVGGIVRFQRSF